MKEHTSFIGNILETLGLKQPKSKKDASKLNRRHLRLEPLEERHMLSVVTIEATDPWAYEAPTSTSANWGYATVRRDQSEATALYVNYEVSGTALHGTDYMSLGAYYSHIDNATGLAVYRGTIAIPANQATAVLTVKPVNDALREGNETVDFKLLSSDSSGCGCGGGSGSTYTLGTDITASVTIEDNDDWTVDVAAVDSSGKETGTGETADPVKFRFTRSGETDLSKSVTVYYQFSGTATPSSDFNVSGGYYDTYYNYGTTSIPVNQSYVDITLNIVNDALPESTETVILTLLEESPYNCGSGCGGTTVPYYSLGTNTTATATIEDNDNWIMNVEAIDATGRETNTGETADPIKFRVTRSGETDLSKSVTVYYCLSGTATPNSDYNVSGGYYDTYYNCGTASISATQSYVDITLNIVNDTLPEPTETVILTLLEESPYGCGCGSGIAYYSLGVNATATATIEDNDGGTITTPSAPTGLSATASSSSQINLSWTASTGATSYTLECSSNGTSGWTTIYTGANIVYSNTGLTANTAYYYRVKASNTAGTSGYSSNANATTQSPAPTIPSAPTGLSATAASSTQINLSWTASTGATSYILERSSNGTSGWTTVYTGSNTSCNNTGLTADTTYYYRVKASNSTGDSGYSSNASGTTQPSTPSAPAAPTGLTSTAVSQTQIDLVWTASAGATSYTLECSNTGTSGWTTVYTGSNTSYNNTGLTANTTYYYRVKASNATGDSGYSSNTNTTTQTTTANPPTTPSSLSASVVSSSQINLSWSSVTGATSYTLERFVGGDDGWIPVYVGSSTSYSNTDLNSKTTYYYRVKAMNSGGDSAYTDYRNATTRVAVPEMPIHLEAEVVSKSQVTLYWVGSTDVATYTLQRSTNGTTWGNVYTGADMTYSNSGLAANANYYYRVCATNTSGSSEYTEGITIQTLPNAPSQPTGLSATATGQTQIDLTWTATNNATEYTLERSSDGSSDWETIYNGSENGYTNLGLTSNTQYYYRVMASNTGGDSTWSSTINRTTMVSSLWTVTAQALSAAGRETNPGEPFAPIVYRFTRAGTGDTSEPLTIFYQLSGTAERGIDYIFQTGDYYDTDDYGVLEIPSGEMSADLVLAIENDTIEESTETVVLTLLDREPDAANAAYISGTINDVATTITDNDAPSAINWTINIQAIDAIGKEIAYGGTSDTITYRLTRSGSADFSQALTVYYEFSGTAKYGDDYEISSGFYDSFYYDFGYVSIPVGAAYVDLTLDIKDDSVIEPTETVVMTLLDRPPLESATQAAYTLGNSISANATIEDNDTPTTDWQVEIEAIEDRVTEPSDGVTSIVASFQITRSEGSSPNQSLAVYYRLSGTAILGDDFTVSSGSYDAISNCGTITIPAGELSVDLSFTILSDEDNEFDEKIIATLLDRDAGNFSTKAGYSLGDAKKATIVIGDAIPSEEEEFLLDGPMQYHPSIPAPIASDDTYFIHSELALVIPAAAGLIANDKLQENYVTEYSVYLEQGPKYGVIVMEQDGSFVYTPNEENSEDDSFIYRVVDAWGNYDTGIVLLISSGKTVFTSPDHYSLTTNETFIVDTTAKSVLANDNQNGAMVGEGAYAELCDGPSHGTLTFNADGTFEYIPDTDYEGVDSFRYKKILSNGDESVETEVLFFVLPEYLPQRQTHSRVIPEGSGPVTLDVITNPTSRITDASLPGADVEIIKGNSAAGITDKIVITFPEDYQGTETLEFTVESSSGTIETDSLNISTTPSDDFISYFENSGTFTPGNIDHDFNTNTVFSPAYSGTFSTSTTITAPWAVTPEEGPAYTGKQSVTQAITSINSGAGNWRYTETVTWYGSSTDEYGNSNVSMFQYTIVVALIGSCEFYSFTSNSIDSIPSLGSYVTTSTTVISIYDRVSGAYHGSESDAVTVVIRSGETISQSVTENNSYGAIAGSSSMTLSKTSVSQLTYSGNTSGSWIATLSGYDATASSFAISMSYNANQGSEHDGQMVQPLIDTGSDGTPLPFTDTAGVSGGYNISGTDQSEISYSITSSGNGATETTTGTYGGTMTSSGTSSTWEAISSRQHGNALEFTTDEGATSEHTPGGYVYSSFIEDASSWNDETSWSAALDAQGEWRIVAGGALNESSYASRSGYSVTQYLGTTDETTPETGGAITSSVSGKVSYRVYEEAEETLQMSQGWSNGAWTPGSGTSTSRFLTTETSSMSMSGTYGVTESGVTSGGRMGISETSTFSAETLLTETVNGQGEWVASSGTSTVSDSGFSSMTMSRNDAIVVTPFEGGSASGYRGDAMSQWSGWESTSTLSLDANGEWVPTGGSGAVSSGYEFGSSYSAYGSSSSVSDAPDTGDGQWSEPMTARSTVSQSSFSGSGFGECVRYSVVNDEWDETTSSLLLTETVSSSSSSSYNVPSFEWSGGGVAKSDSNSSGYNYRSVIAFTPEGDEIEETEQTGASETWYSNSSSHYARYSPVITDWDGVWNDPGGDGTLSDLDLVISNELWYDPWQTDPLPPGYQDPAQGIRNSNVRGSSSSNSTTINYALAPIEDYEGEGEGEGEGGGIDPESPIQVDLNGYQWKTSGGTRTQRVNEYESQTRFNGNSKINSGSSSTYSANGRVKQTYDAMAGEWSAPSGQVDSSYTDKVFSNWNAEDDYAAVILGQRIAGKKSFSGSSGSTRSRSITTTYSDSGSSTTGEGSDSSYSHSSVKVSGKSLGHFLSDIIGGAHYSESESSNSGGSVEYVYSETNGWVAVDGTTSFGGSRGWSFGYKQGWNLTPVDTQADNRFNYVVGGKTTSNWASGSYGDSFSGSKTIDVASGEWGSSQGNGSGSGHITSGTGGNITGTSYMSMVSPGVYATGTYKNTEAYASSQHFISRSTLTNGGWETNFFGKNTTNHKRNFALNDAVNFDSSNTIIPGYGGSSGMVRIETISRSLSKSYDLQTASYWIRPGGGEEIVMSSETKKQDIHNYNSRGTFGDIGTGYEKWNVGNTSYGQNLQSKTTFNNGVTTNDFLHTAYSKGKSEEWVTESYHYASSHDAQMSRSDSQSNFTVENQICTTIQRYKPGVLPGMQEQPLTTVNYFNGDITVNDPMGSINVLPEGSAWEAARLTFGSNGVGVSLPAELRDPPKNLIPDINYNDFIPRPPEPPLPADMSGISGPIDTGWWNTICEVYKGYGLGLGQGVANTINGVQDVGVGIANIGLIGYNGTSWVVNALGGENPYYWIPSPDWSRDLIVPEYGEPGTWGDTHAWSKWCGGNGVFAGLAAKDLAGSALGNTPVTQLPGKMKDGLKGAFKGLRDNVKRFVKGSPNCFTEGTQIVVGMGLAEDGTVLYDTKNIEDIQVGDLVYSYDTMTGEVSQRKVTSTSTNTTKHVNQLVIVGENGVEQTLETTDGHPFWVVTDDPDLSRAARNVIHENGVWLHHENLGVTENGYWVEAKDLRVGDVFLGADGTLSVLVSKLRLETENGIAIFNFEVEGNHNYFVLAKEFEYGQTCVLVHNNSGDWIKVFRVEGKGNQRIFIDTKGNVTIPDKERMLHLNFGQEGRAKEFLRQRLAQFPDDKIKSFEVPKKLLEEIRKKSIPQDKVKELGKNRPQIDDPTKAPDQYGLPPQYIKFVENNIRPGSGQ